VRSAVLFFIFVHPKDMDTECIGSLDDLVHEHTLVIQIESYQQGLYVCNGQVSCASLRTLDVVWHGLVCANH
jgi:hypothetical protein